MKHQNIIVPIVIILYTVNFIVQALPYRRTWYKDSCTNRKYPYKNDRIAIIGAGPAGVHMAYKLQLLGYNDVTIFEKNNRVGGKCHTVHHKGTRHEMGATYTTVDYAEIFDLLKKFDMGPVISPGTTSRWVDDNRYFGSEYPLYIMAKEYGITDRVNATAFLFGAVQRYIQLHKSLFSEYEGDLFPRPNATVLELTNGTFIDFLKRNNIDVLKTLFITTQVATGYGQLDEIAALYGLIWNTPRFVSALIGQQDAVGALQKGYQPLLEEMVRREKIKIIFNANIRSIIRRRDIRIRYSHYGKSNNCNYIKTSQFDFLILASNIKEMISSTLRYPSREECRIFKKQNNAFITGTLLDTDYGRRGVNPSDFYLNRIDAAIEQDVWIRVDSYGMVNGLSGNKYKNGEYPGNSLGEFLESSVFYQYGDNRPNDAILNRKLQEYRNTFGYRNNYTIIQRDIFPYFPRFSPVDMSTGILWDILDLQGYKNTWYIGGSASFESVKSVMEYNNLLLRKFNLE